MRRLVFLALLMLALPMAAFADSSLVFQNLGGTLKVGSGGVSLTKSKLTEIDGLNGGGPIVGTGKWPALGTLSFTTGAELSSSFDPTTGVTTTIFAGGGTFTITGSGRQGVPRVVLFHGTFSGDVTVVSNPATKDVARSFMLSGAVTGMYNGTTLNGQVVQLRVGPTKVSGTTSVAGAVPEPSTLGMFGTGLVGMAGLLRRRKKVA